MSVNVSKLSHGYPLVPGKDSGQEAEALAEGIPTRSCRKRLYPGYCSLLPPTTGRT